MCGRGDQVSIFKGGGNGFGCYQATDVGHVSKQVGLNVSAQLKEKVCKRGNKHKIRIHIYTIWQEILNSFSGCRIMHTSFMLPQ